MCVCVGGDVQHWCKRECVCLGGGEGCVGGGGAEWGGRGAGEWAAPQRTGRGVDAPPLSRSAGTQKERSVVSVAQDICKLMNLPVNKAVHVRDRAFNDRR